MRSVTISQCLDTTHHRPLTTHQFNVLVEQPGVLATLSRWRTWVQIPSGTLDECVGWAWASPHGCNPYAYAIAGSTPARRTARGPLVYRQRTPAPQAGRMGSTPIRATRYDQVVEPADTRRSERRAFGRGSSTLPLVTCLDGETDIMPRFERGVPGSNPGRGICLAESLKMLAML